MKLMIFTAIIFLSVSIAKGQQQLSYTYDTAGNRTNRTVVVGAQNPFMGDSQKETYHTYTDSLGDKQVLITSESRVSTLLIKVEGYNPTTKGKYSISDTEGKILTSRDLHNKITTVELDELPSGNYILELFLNAHTSVWNLQKL